MYTDPVEEKYKEFDDARLKRKVAADRTDAYFYLRKRSLKRCFFYSSTISLLWLVSIFAKEPMHFGTDLFILHSFLAVTGQILCFVYLSRYDRKLDESIADEKKCMNEELKIIRYINNIQN